MSLSASCRRQRDAQRRKRLEDCAGMSRNRLQLTRLARQNVLLHSPSIETRTIEMNWGIEDFTAAATLFAAAWIGIALVRRNVHGRVLRPILLVGVVLVVLMIWAHLAVGIV
jgi:hypothetical protein